jgi:serine/threonine protein kinase
MIARLREALAPQYSVDKEIGAGGMGAVFRGYDRSLDRAVAIKVLRPELATARGAERFMHEARTLAQLSHPNVVPVHQAGEAGGLYYFIMDFLEGETLRDRLEQGPLTSREAVKMGRDILSALDAVHAAGVVHRDVKPANVILLGDRAVLGDFGIAKDVDPAVEPLTGVGERVGSPGYMAPEHIAGGQSTERSDLYAAGMILYESITGRKWPSMGGPSDADWSGVPRRVHRVLERALATAPENRWADAAMFAAALRATQRPSKAPAAALAAVAIVALGLLARSLWLGPPLPALAGEGQYDLALPPCRTVPAADSAMGSNLMLVVALHLGPHVRVADGDLVLRWWTDAAARGEPRPDQLAEAFGASYVADCRLFRNGDSLELELDLVGHPGSDPLSISNLGGRMRGRAADVPLDLADAVAAVLLQATQRTVTGEALSATSRLQPEALISFIEGERALLRDDRLTAEARYQEAILLEPSFAMATWRLSQVRRWLIKASGIDLQALYDQQGSELGEVDRALLEARIAPPGAERLAMHGEVVARYPQDAYSALLYADELFHRGPLLGISLDSARTMFRIAVARDSFLAPAYEHLILLAIQQGRADDARTHLARLERITPRRGGMDLADPDLLHQAILERFAPDSALLGRAALQDLPAPRLREVLMLPARYTGSALDLAGTQLALGRMLSAAAGPETMAAISGHLAQGLALTALGDLPGAHAQFDSAAVREAGVETALQVDQLVLLIRALGLLEDPADDYAFHRGRLESTLQNQELPAHLRIRAGWVLGLDAAAAGDQGSLQARRDQLQVLLETQAPADRDRRPLDFLEAVAEARRDGWAEAARASAPLANPDSAGDLRYPFLRSAVHLKRGEWFRLGGEPDSAAASWLWYEASDLVGVPRERLQAGEIDWSLGTHGRYLRASAYLATGRNEEACTFARQAYEIWSGGGPVASRLAALALELMADAQRRAEDLDPTRPVCAEVLELDQANADDMPDG